MTELDYAFLADYAVVEGGRLTAVGASFTHVSPERLPALFALSVAGRIRAAADTELVLVGIEINGPGGEQLLRAEAEVRPNESARPYDGKIGLLFAATTALWLPSDGLYEVHISINGEHARRLAFEAGPNPAG